MASLTNLDLYSYKNYIKQKLASFRYLFAKHALILCYHRVNEESASDPFHLNVNQVHFAEHLEILKKYYHPIRLVQLVEAIKHKEIPPRVVVITFDDGYDDNLYFVKPLLEKYDIPATVFITSGYIGGESEFWWDKLAKVFFDYVQKPAMLHLYRDDDGWHANESIKGYKNMQRHYKWHIPKMNNSFVCNRILLFLQRLCLTLEEEKRIRLIDELYAWVNTNMLHKPYYALSAQEIKSLIRGSLVEVGAHTLSHPILSSLTDYEQLKEIKQSKVILEEIINAPVISFSYPIGQLMDYNFKTVSMVRVSGFVCACIAVDGFIHTGVDCYQLPRKTIWDWNGDRFEQEIQGYFI